MTDREELTPEQTEVPFDLTDEERKQAEAIAAEYMHAFYQGEDMSELPDVPERLEQLVDQIVQKYNDRDFDMVTKPDPEIDPEDGMTAEERDGLYEGMDEALVRQHKAMTRHNRRMQQLLEFKYQQQVTPDFLKEIYIAQAFEVLLPLGTPERLQVEIAFEKKLAEVLDKVRGQMAAVHQEMKRRERIAAENAQAHKGILTPQKKLILPGR